VTSFNRNETNTGQGQPKRD